jgi:hypothetical protein
VGVGDLFLFWGLFRRVDEKLRWTGPPLHVVWGWMQIGAVVAVDGIRGETAWAWAARHPHFFFEADRTNTLYTSSTALTAVASPLPAAGVFERFGDGLSLTAREADKPTIWGLPSCFMAGGKPALSYHKANWRWTLEGNQARLQTVSRGQEFVLDCARYPKAVTWIEKILANGLPRSDDKHGGEDV